MNNEQAGDQPSKEMNTHGNCDELPVVVWTERRKPWKKGLTALLRSLRVGEEQDMGDYERNGVYAIARNLNITVQTSIGRDGKLYIKRTS